MEIIKKDYSKLIIGLSFLIILVLLCNAIYYGYINHSSIIRADQWRFIELYLYPIYDHSFEFKLLWSDHHPNALIALLFMGFFLFLVKKVLKMRWILL